MSDPTVPTIGTIESDETLEVDSEGALRSPTGPRIRAPIPSRLGRYHIVSLLGRGGMGTVYAAEDPELGRKVAIKVLRDDLDAADRDGLRREAQALARLVHPNVVTVHDVGVSGEQVFLVMQLVDGEPIDRWAKATRASPAAIVAAFRQAGRGLAAAHDAGLVHCDVKPGNILVDRRGDVRIGDFGIARIATELATASSTPTVSGVAGTPAYMAPEQLAGLATPASDQFAFCVALWEVLAGERPFDDVQLDTATGTRSRGPQRTLPRAANVPAHVQRALARGLSLDPAARFPSMAALGAALGPPRWRRAAAIGGLAVVVVAGTALVATRASRESSTAPAIGRADRAAIHPLTQLGSQVCAYAPTIEPDNRVVFDRTELDAVDLYAVPLAGGVPAQLTFAPTWEWRAHAGRRAGEVIHLITDPKGSETDIAFLDLATGAETVISPVAAADAIAIGDSVFYTPRKSIEIRRIEGGRDQVFITATAGQHFVHLAASPAGDRFAVIGPNDAGGVRVCLIDVTSARIECLPNLVRGERPAFGSDGRSLYYAAADGLHAHDVVTGVDEVVLAGVELRGGLSVAPDGSAIVYSACGTHSQIVDVSEHPPKVVVADEIASEPSIATNGVIAYLRLVRQRWVLMVRDQDGTTAQLTGSEYASTRTPAISRDGELVAFVAAGPHAGIQIARAGDPGSIEQVTDDARDANPVWLADGRIGFTRYDEHDLPTACVVPRDGGAIRRFGVASRGVYAARGDELLVAGRDAVYWLNATTGAERPGPPLPAQVAGIAVSPNGDWLAFELGAEGQDVVKLDLRDPHGTFEKVFAVRSGQTVGRVAITDQGHVLLAPTTWSGDLEVIPAAAGSRF